MTTDTDHFRLRFASSQIPRLAASYSYGTPAEAVGVGNPDSITRRRRSTRG